MRALKKVITFMEIVAVNLRHHLHSRVGTYSIKLQCHTLYYGEFHAEQESEIRFALSRILDLLRSLF